MHAYYSRASAPPLIDWGLLPPRLSSLPFYANQNATQRHFAALGSDVRALLAPPSVAALQAKLDQGYSNVESVLSKVRHLV
jgi:hypothetical protein